MWAKLVLSGAKMVLTGVNLDQFNKMAPQRVKSAPGTIELNRHFGAETDLLNLQWTVPTLSSVPNVPTLPSVPTVPTVRNVLTVPKY